MPLQCSSLARPHDEQIVAAGLQPPRSLAVARWHRTASVGNHVTHPRSAIHPATIAMTRGVAIWSILLQLEPLVRSEAFPWGLVAWILGWGAVAVWPRAAVSVFRVRLGLMLVSLGAAFALTLWAGGGLGGPARLSLSWMPLLVAMFGTWKQTAWATATLGLATAAGAMASAWPDPVGQDLVLAASRMLGAGATGLVGVGMMAAFRGAVSGASASSVQHPSSAASAALPTDVTSVPMLPLGVVGDVAGTPTLTAIEREVVDGLAAGLTPQQIALREGWDVRRVYDAVAHAKSTFGAQTIEHLVVLVTVTGADQGVPR